MLKPSELTRDAIGKRVRYRSFWMNKAGMHVTTDYVARIVQVDRDRVCLRAEGGHHESWVLRHGVTWYPEGAPAIPPVGEIDPIEPPVPANDEA